MTDKLKKSLMYSIVTFVVTMMFFMIFDMADAVSSDDLFSYSAVWHLSFPTACAALDFVITYFGCKDKSERALMGVSYD